MHTYVHVQLSVVDSHREFTKKKTFWLKWFPGNTKEKGDAER